jgi:hypothetical protein
LNFVDRTVLGLADPSSRAAIFDQAALAGIVASGYDAASIATTGPYAATFERLELGPDLSAEPALDGSWQSADGSSRVSLHLDASGFADASAPAVAALWTGAVAAKAVVGNATITGVRESWSGDGVRFESAATVTMSAPVAAAPPADVVFPIVAAVFVADAPLALLDLLRESAKARARIAKARPIAPPRGLPAGDLPVALWIVPASLFDDAAWPGATAGMAADDARTARRERAASWLASQHVALAVTS